MTPKGPQSLPAGCMIGIIGGGQLGRMLAMAAARLGYRIAVYDPASDPPAGQLANSVVTGRFDDRKKLLKFAAHCDCVTYEFENIPVQSVQALSEIVAVRPGVAALEKSQDRLVEKRFLNGLGIDTAPFHDVSSRADLESAVAALGGQGIVKTRRLGYDGKGQYRIDGSDPDRKAIDALLDRKCIVEGVVDFSMEISVIGIRGTDGAFACYDPSRNRHESGILRNCVVPAQVSEYIADSARAIARRIMDGLEYVGVMGVEFFVVEPERLLVNEIAPRVHNSGHWTEAACLVSQFENHIRAIAGLPLGQTARHSDCEMINLIGDEIADLPHWASRDSCLVHCYGKKETRSGRKMGHVTRIMPQTTV